MKYPSLLLGLILALTSVACGPGSTQDVCARSAAYRNQNSDACQTCQQNRCASQRQAAATPTCTIGLFSATLSCAGSFSAGDAGAGDGGAVSSEQGCRCVMTALPSECRGGFENLAACMIDNCASECM